MRTRRILIISLSVTAVLWSIFSWPLPRYAVSGIPASAHNPDGNRPLRMIPGDHLQLLYHFDLARDMVAGKTPLFQNRYEFNTGDDKARYMPGSYFAPFSLAYAAFAALGSQALGWNLTALLALWLTYLGTWLLARRYARIEPATALFALAGALIPFRWINLFGGSPAGLAMMWIPWIYLGLDIAVRERRFTGSALSGTALIFLAMTDTQAFFFTTLSVPFWCAVAFFRREEFEWRNMRDYVASIIPLLPLTVFGAAAIAYIRIRQHVAVSGSAMHSGRDLAEISLYSPAWRGLFMPATTGADAHIYIGFVIPLLLVSGLCMAAYGLFPGKNTNPLPAKHRITLLLLCLGAAITAILAMGTRGPFDGYLLVLCRKLIPPYRMLRQPAKIFCLMPTILAVGAAVSCSMVASRIRHSGLRCLTIILLPLIAVCDFKLRIDPAICLLDESQAAYEAVAHDAAAAGRPARAVAVPLWPGDSAWSSLYQHYGLMYRIRMLNGYSPAVSREYVKDVFNELHGINKGILTDGHLDMLQRMGVEYVILHENAFPEKVSPFPVCFTLKNLLNHPRLSLLKQEGPVWAFAILGNAGPRDRVGRSWRYFFPSRRWQLEYCADSPDTVLEDESAAHGRYVRLTTPGSTVATIRHPAPTFVPPAPRLRWLVRARGHGGLKAACMAGPATNNLVYVGIESSDWIWARIPATGQDTYERLRLDLALDKGEIDLDTAILVAGDWPTLLPGQSIEIPAPCFFHAGHTDLESDSVVFAPDTEPAQSIFYGPHLPLEKGVYKAEMVLDSSAPPNAELGTLTIKAGGSIMSRLAVRASQPAAMRLLQEHNFPVRLDFRYGGAYALTIRAVRITRLQAE